MARLVRVSAALHALTVLLSLLFAGLIVWARLCP